MRFSAVLALIAAATVVAAETNAERFARGLPPMPAKRASPVQAARRSFPSKLPGKPPGNPHGKSPSGECDTGALQCCEQTSKCGEGGEVDTLTSLLGINVSPGTVAGTKCSGIASSTDCTQQPVCCNDNKYNGLIAIGCSPINIL